MDRKMTDKEAYPAAWAVVILAGMLYALWKYVWGEPTISGCWIYQNLGVYCPGCGGTRAVIALSRGKIFQALYYHPAVPVTFFIGALYLLSQTIWRLRGRQGWALHYDDRWPFMLLGLFLFHCALRNLLWLGLGIPL